IHRAQVLQVAGAWTDAASEAERAHERLLRLRPPRSGGLAHYQLGEIHRLRGELDAAEAAYGAAAKAGYDPQPGLALLRVAQGRQAQARASVDRVLLSTSPPLQRIPYLAAGVEICVACGDAGAARAHSEELERIASELGTPALRALSDDARGAVELAAGNAAEAPRCGRPSRRRTPMRARWSTSRGRAGAWAIWTAARCGERRPALRWRSSAPPRICGRSMRKCSGPIPRARARARARARRSRA